MLFTKSVDSIMESFNKTIQALAQLEITKELEAEEFSNVINIALEKKEATRDEQKRANTIRLKLENLVDAE